MIDAKSSEEKLLAVSSEDSRGDQSPDGATMAVGRENKSGKVESLSLKTLSLVSLAVQNAALIIVMRYVRSRPGPMFASSTAVVMSELLKIWTCLIVILSEHGFNLKAFFHHLHENILKQPRDCLRVSIPAFVYMLQNNLIYVAASHLDAATFQVTYQLKILTTALLSVIMLKKRLTKLQWCSLIILFVGVAAVNVQANNASAANKTRPAATLATTVAAASTSLDHQHQNPIVGFLAVLAACVLSGFAGVYFEKILKSTPQSIYVRNIQLGVIGGLLGLGPVYYSDGDKVFKYGFFYGYDLAVWAVIAIHGFGGIIVAVVIKYADNILKGFASSAAIIIACLASIYFFNFELTELFLLGATLVVISTYMYSRFVPPPSAAAPVANSFISVPRHEELGVIKIV